MIFKDYYKILGLNTNKVSGEQIKVSFREQAKKYHPDVNVENKRTEERFKDINEAYRVLSNNSNKRKYDRMWNTHIARRQNKIKYEESKRQKDSVFSDFFKMFFIGDEKEQTTKESMDTETTSRIKKIPVKGENVETEINVGIEDAFFGLEKKIALRTIARKNENI